MRPAAIFVFAFLTGVSNALAATAPVANAQGVVTPGDSAKAITLTAHDVDPGALTFSVVGAPSPSAGTLGAIASPTCAVINFATRCTATITYTPTAGFKGTTSFTFRASDGALDSNVATVTVTVGLDEGPGGPILLITTSSNPFTRYYGEILRAEGLNQFAVADISSVSRAVLDGFDLVILGEMPLSLAQASMLTTWVGDGGKLIAMRPDKQLAGVLGLIDTGLAPLSEAYLAVDVSTGPGAGITPDSMQFHGDADLYALNGAVQIAVLYSAAGTASSNPAVTMRVVGPNGGSAAAFTYDLARSIVYTRQGNPAYSGLDRDGDGVVRSDDLFYSGAQPDWLDVQKVAIPQADEQQRLLANLVLTMERNRMPLPRFWYFPRNTNPQINVNKAVIIMTGDDHATGGTVGRFDRYKALSPANCSVADWECIRSSSFVYSNTAIADTAAAAYTADGFELALHVNHNECQRWTPATLESVFATQLGNWSAAFRSAPSPSSNRTHCLTWSDFATQPAVELAHGIRLDTNYYYYPPALAATRPGFFTGSGIPMRFTDASGRLIDVYQATTQMTDESQQGYPSTVNALLANALGPKGYYGAFTVNAHTDQVFSAVSEAIIGSAREAGVPVVSGRQMLHWLDGRNASSFGYTSRPWDPMTSSLSFTITQAAGATGLQAMIPTTSAIGPLKANGITQEGNPNPVAYTTQVIKGQEYAFFTGRSGAYRAVYDADTTAPTITAVLAVPRDGSATITWNTNESSSSTIEFGLAPGSLTQRRSHAGLELSHAVVLDGLTPRTTYFYRVTSVDAYGNSTTSPSGEPASFVVPSGTLVDTTVADFSAGTTGTNTFITSAIDGEVTLAPAAATEFAGNALPAGWSFTAWGPGGTAVVAGGNLTVDGGLASADAFQAPGRSLEFVATFGATAFEHVGFGQTLATSSESWAYFSTFNTTNALYARTGNNGVAADTLIPGTWIGSAHRFRIDWTASSVMFSIDGQLVATHTVAIAANMRPIVSEFAVGGASASIDSLRMTPYAASGSFVSRVFGAGGPVSWGNVVWTASTPTGTTLALAVRTGNTPDPNHAASDWTTFRPLAASGAVSARSTYLQYRADLSTGDLAATPALNDVTIGFLVGQPPIAVDDGVTTAENATTGGNVLTNDSDADGDALTAVQVSGPASGTLTLAADGAFSYTPDASFNGNATFRYQAQDPSGALSNVATVTITITAQNDPPIANADAGSTVEDVAVTFAASALTANDSRGPANENAQMLTVTAVGNALNGTVVLNANNTITFTPSPNVNGAAGFSYTVSDNGTTNGAPDPKQATGTVAVNVSAVNDPPTANPAGRTTAEDTALRVLVSDLTANDSTGPPNEAGQRLTVVAVGGAVNGAVALNADSSVTFTPAANFNGTASFTYTVQDDGTTNGVLDPKQAIGTLTVAVTSVNDQPVANADSKTTRQNIPLTFPVTDLTANDSPGPANESAQRMTFAGVAPTASTHGTVTIVSGNVIYAPDLNYVGPASFTYTICDDGSTNGAADPKCSTGTVHVSVTPVNDAPVANSDTKSASEDEPLTFPAAGLTANDSPGPPDESGQTLTVIAVGAASGGTVVLNPDNTITFRPAANFNGPASFTYTVRDNGTTDGAPDPKQAIGIVAVAVTAVNDPPVATSDSRTTKQNLPLTIPVSDLMANDVTGPADESAQRLTFTGVTPTASTHGTLTVLAGNVVYAPDLLYVGAASFTYTICDDGTTNGLPEPKCSTGTVNVSVSPILTLGAGLDSPTIDRPPAPDGVAGIINDGS